MMDAPATSRVRDRAQYLLCAALGALGLVQLGEKAGGQALVDLDGLVPAPSFDVQGAQAAQGAQGLLGVIARDAAQ